MNKTYCPVCGEDLNNEPFCSECGEVGGHKDYSLQPKAVYENRQRAMQGKVFREPVNYLEKELEEKIEQATKRITNNFNLDTDEKNEVKDILSAIFTYDYKGGN